jgi:putative tryptophan/tyrosine transport system substrate-binding protein
MKRREFIAGLAGVALYPLGVRAQQPDMPVVGFLSPDSSGPATAALIAGFTRGLAELNYVPERNVAIDYRWAEGHSDRLPALAADLVRRPVSLIVAPSEAAALAAKAATTAIPIVFDIGGDPVAIGLVTRMRRPGGNATGLSLAGSELEAKRLGLLQELAPAHRAAGLLLNPDNANAEGQLRQSQAAARALGMQLHVGRASIEAELDVAFEGLVQAGTKMLLAAADPFFASMRQQLLALAARHRIPTMWGHPDFVKDGGLMSYGTNLTDEYRQMGLYSGKILGGAKPATLPVLRPARFELAINLNTARTLGLEVPPTILARADDVIK